MIFRILTILLVMSYLLIASGTMFYLNRYARRNGGKELVKLLNTYARTDRARKVYWFGIFAGLSYVTLAIPMALSVLAPGVYEGKVDGIFGEMQIGLFTLCVCLMFLSIPLMPHGHHLFKLAWRLCDGEVEITFYKTASGRRGVDWSKTSNHY